MLLEVHDLCPRDVAWVREGLRPVTRGRTDQETPLARETYPGVTTSIVSSVNPVNKVGGRRDFQFIFPLNHVYEFYSIHRSKPIIDRVISLHSDLLISRINVLHLCFVSCCMCDWDNNDRSHITLDTLLHASLHSPPRCQHTSFCVSMSPCLTITSNHASNNSYPPVQTIRHLSLSLSLSASGAGRCHLKDCSDRTKN